MRPWPERRKIFGIFAVNPTGVWILKGRPHRIPPCLLLRRLGRRSAAHAAAGVAVEVAIGRRAHNQH